MVEDDNTLRYDKMVERALRGVVVDALTLAATQGLPGDHHFYITFRTRAAGVRLSDHILARHPDEMTIVLQHQFWDLTVDDDAFAVTLSFSGVSERLYIPFSAVTGFADPSAKFGLQFQVEEDDLFELEEEAVEMEPAPFSDPREDLPEGGAKVIALDAFRKK